MGQIIEICGCIKKQENLATLEHNILDNTWVLETTRPFPGYHGKNLPDESNPRSLFLVLDEEYSFEDIWRITAKVKGQFQGDFDATAASIFFRPYTYQAIRLKYLSSFDLIPQLQHLYAHEGVRFMKYRYLEREAIIQVKKVFELICHEEGIYQDRESDIKYYFEIPDQLKWKDFKEYTARVKNNVIDYNFDAALGIFYRYQGIVDVVRIFDRRASLEKVRLLRQKYREVFHRSRTAH